MDADNFRGLAGDIAIYVGLVVGMLKLLDWVLRKPQKDWIQDKSETLWLKLSEYSARTILLWAGKRKSAYGACIIVHWSIAGFYIIGILYLLMFGDYYRELEESQSSLLVKMSIGTGFLFFVLGIVLRRPWHVFLKFYASDGNVFVCAVKTVTTFFVLFLSLFGLMKFALMNLDTGFISHINDDFFNGAISIELVFMFLFGLFFTVLYLFVLAFLVLWMVMILVLYAESMVFIARFILLRIVEHAKGPVLGLAGLLIAIGAIVKFSLT